MRILRFFSLSVCVFAAMSSLRADTLNFDNIDASAGDVPLTSYQGFNFENFSVYTATPGFPGFNNGIVSGPNAAYSSDTGVITAATTFDFMGGEFGSGYYDNLSVEIDGLLGGVVTNSKTITVSTTGAQSFAFAFTGIDTLRFTSLQTAATTDPYFCGSVGCSYFTVDDAMLKLDAAPPPPPSTVTPEPSSLLLLLTSGIFAMLPAWRSRFTHR